MRALLQQYGVHAPIRVIPTGLPLDRFAAGNGARFRAAHELPSERPLLLYVGRVAYEKNINFLLHVLVALRRTRPDAMLVIAGEGPARAHLRQLAVQLGLAGDIFFVGYLERQQALVDCYAAADVFVFASRTETQGLVLLEALAQGRPVVSTAHLGTASILRPRCGARVAPEEADAFANAVLEVLEDPVRAEHLSQQARLYAREWASPRMAARLAELYAEVAPRALPNDSQRLDARELPRQHASV
jgi:glycosyltransferase involved in cell wall biosynthesis